jgi:2-amino-4-hydroxy-6-hydroxymethyldihydropteridine diphosphokinase
MITNTVYLLLGSNIDKETNIPNALEELKNKTKVLEVSSILETPPIGTTNQANFHNCAVKIETPLNEKEIKENIITPIETQLKRVRTQDPNSARTIDIDVIIYNDRVVDDEFYIYSHINKPIRELIKQN